MDQSQFLSLRIGDIIFNENEGTTVEVTSAPSPGEEPDFWVSALCLITGDDLNIMIQDCDGWSLLTTAVFDEVCKCAPAVGALLTALNYRVSALEEFVDTLNRSYHGE